MSPCSPTTMNTNPTSEGKKLFLELLYGSVGHLAAPFSTTSFAVAWKSLLGNAVFRWEYMPGSALFLVWTQTRSQRDRDPAFQLGRSLRRAWDADADNVFSAKVTYYFNR